MACVPCAVLFSTAPCRMQCLRMCGKCRAAFRRVPCCASALSSPRSAIFRLASEASASQLHCNLRAVSLVSRHFPRLHGALSSSPASLAALCVASALTAEVIRQGICGGLHRAAAHRIAIHPHLPGRMPSAERRLRRLPRLRLASLHAGDRALCAVIALSVFCRSAQCRSVFDNSLSLHQEKSVSNIGLNGSCCSSIIRCNNECARCCAMKVFQVRIAHEVLSAHPICAILVLKTIIAPLCRRKLWGLRRNK